MKGHERPRAARVSELKAKLSEYLRAVRRGETITVMDRDTPVARIVPYDPGPEPLRIRRATRRLHDLKMPPPLDPPVDSLAYLLEERQRDR